MKTPASIIIAIIVIILIVICAAYFLMTMHAPAPLPQQTSAQALLAQGLPTAQISISNFAFVPAGITVKAGTIITWTNQDSVGHQIKSDTFSSVVLNHGDTYQNTFVTPGTYNYICAIHPTMKGTIIVNP